jgi:hypothetical protein
MSKLPERVNITLTLPEVDVVLQSMGRQPYDAVADLIASIRNQVIPQVQAAAMPPATPEAKGEADVAAQ